MVLKIVGHIFRYMSIVCLVIVVILIAGCTGAQVVSPTPTPTPAPTPVPKPVVFFNYNPSSGYAPLQVGFTDQSSNSPTAWLWNFGDGGTSTLQNPTHIFSNAGTYTVSLTAVNAGGSSSDSKTVIVNAVPTAQVIYVTPVPTAVPTAAPTATVPTAAPQVVMTATNYHIDYTGTTGYFGPSTQAGSGSTVNAGSTFTRTITFTNDALMFSHTIDSITIQTPGFTLLSVSPSVPSSSLSVGSSITETLTIQAPNSAYTGSLEIRISTS